MARYRGIKEEFYQDKKVSKLSFMGRLLFQGMWIQSDDAAICRGDTALLKSRIFPYDKISNEEVDKEIVKMCLLRFIVMIEQNEQFYFWIRTFLKHQSINRPSKARYINPGEFVTFYEPKGNIENTKIDSITTPCILREYSVSSQVQVSYQGDKNNEIQFIRDDLKGLENTSFPNPNDDQEYYDLIMKMRKGEICPICQRKYSLNQKDIHDNFPTIDHIIPRSRGGDHSPENLHVICAKCNTEKYNTPTLLSEYSVSSPGGLIPYASTKEKKRKEIEYKRERERESNTCDEYLKFDDFWRCYPRKEDRLKAEAAYRKAFEIVGHELLIRCISEHPKMKNNDVTFIPLAHNFLNSTPWADLKEVKKPWKNLLNPKVIDEISTENARQMAAEKFRN